MNFFYIFKFIFIVNKKKSIFSLQNQNVRVLIKSFRK